MATINAAAVQQERTYAASGYVVDDYIYNDAPPASASFVGGFKTSSLAFIVGVSSKTIIPSRLKWEFIAEPSDIWADEDHDTSSWSQIALSGGSWAEASNASQTWTEIINQDSNFG